MRGRRLKFEISPINFRPVQGDFPPGIVTDILCPLKCREALWDGAIGMSSRAITAYRIEKGKDRSGKPVRRPNNLTLPKLNGITKPLSLLG